MLLLLLLSVQWTVYDMCCPYIVVFFSVLANYSDSFGPVLEKLSDKNNKIQYIISSVAGSAIAFMM